MRRILIISVAIVAIVCSADAQEHTQSGKDLIEACRSIANSTAPTPDNILRVGICYGEIEALKWFAQGVNDENLRSCVPTSVTRQQMAKVVVAYLDQDLAGLGEPFEGLALEALTHKWRCPHPRGWFGKWLN
jgi:hypothetical protein